MNLIFKRTRNVSLAFILYDHFELKLGIVLRDWQFLFETVNMLVVASNSKTKEVKELRKI